MSNDKVFQIGPIKVVVDETMEDGAWRMGPPPKLEYPRCIFCGKEATSDDTTRDGDGLCKTCALAYTKGWIDASNPNP